MHNNKIFWLTLSATLLAGAVFVFTLFRSPNELRDGSGVVTNEQIEAVQTTPPAAVVNSETGEVDVTKFERNQAVNEDTSLTTIEQELEASIILEEDFSNL